MTGMNVLSGRESPLGQAFFGSTPLTSGGMKPIVLGFRIHEAARYAPPLLTKEPRMTPAPLRGLRGLFVSLFALSFVSCAATQNMMPAGLSDALGQVTGLGDSIGNWKSSLSGALDSAGLGKLKDFAGKAGDIGKSIAGMKDGLSEAMSDPLGAIGDKLKDLSGLDVDELRNLAPGDQMKAVDGFTESASGVSKMAKEFLDKFGS